MNTKTILTLLGVVLFGAGLVMAISGATVSNVDPQDRWVVSATPGNVTTEGGNITYVDVGAESLTDRWAAFYGNVTGSLVLRDNTNTTAAVFEWNNWNASAGGVVCASRYANLTWVDVGSQVASSVDTEMGFDPTAADSAENTYTGSANCRGMNFGNGLVMTDTSMYVKHTTGTYWTCLFTVTTSPGAGNAFCTNITNGNLNFKAEPVNYEIMVPTFFGPTNLTTYYFYANLN